MRIIHCVACDWIATDDADQYLQMDLHWAETNHSQFSRDDTTGQTQSTEETP